MCLRVLSRIRFVFHKFISPCRGSPKGPPLPWRLDSVFPQDQWPMPVSIQEQRLDDVLGHWTDCSTKPKGSIWLLVKSADTVFWFCAAELRFDVIILEVRWCVANIIAVLLTFIVTERTGLSQQRDVEPTVSQCWPPSSTLAQHWIYIGSTPCVCLHGAMPEKCHTVFCGIHWFYESYIKYKLMPDFCGEA